MRRQISILFVDDNEQLLRSYRVRVRGQDATFVTTVADALDFMRRRADVDIVVSDYDLGKGTGLDVLRYAEQLLPRAVRVLLTGNIDTVPQHKDCADKVIGKASAAERSLFDDLAAGRL